MTEDEAQRSIRTFYEVVKINAVARSGQAVPGNKKRCDEISCGAAGARIIMPYVNRHGFFCSQPSKGLSGTVQSYDYGYLTLCRIPEIIKRNLDEVVKSQKMIISVIPAQAGIQEFQSLTKTLDTGFHLCDDFLRDHQP